MGIIRENRFVCCQKDVCPKRINVTIIISANKKVSSAMCHYCVCLSASEERHENENEDVHYFSYSITIVLRV